MNSESLANADTKKNKSKNKKAKKNKAIASDGTVVQKNDDNSEQQINEHVSQETEEQVDGAVGGQSQAKDPEEVNKWTYSKLQDIKKAVEMLNLYQTVPAKTPEEAMKRRYEFWETQPVPKLEEMPDKSEPIESKTVNEVKPESYHLPQGFTWDTLDINDDAIVCLVLLINSNL